jgi:GxxExxY protein
MPIHLPPRLRQLDEGEFTKVAYHVMQAVFAVHNEMGCHFDEPVYQRAVAQRITGARIEVPIEVSFETFCKRYSLDLLVADGAVFELKVAERFTDRHRAQLLNYLLLLEVPHGKLVNFRGDLVEHEFVNAPLTRADRISFEVDDRGYTGIPITGRDLKDLLITILRDWGTCLDVSLYEEALIHFLGGEPQVAKPVPIYAESAVVGHQTLNLLSDDASFCVTVLNDGLQYYEDQLRRFLRHTLLKTMQWLNVGRKLVTFRTISG